jgi:ornithine decarboxylase
MVKMKPKFTISKDKALQQYKTIAEIGDIISYSSKTNPKITPILEENTSCLFSIHLKNELKNIKDRNRVLFLAQGWKEQDILELTNQNITQFVVDNEPDLDILLNTINKYKIKITLLLRLKLKERTLRTERHFVFGMSEKVINKRIQELNTENIESLGVHFHRKSQNMAEWNLKYEIEQSLEENTLRKIDTLNIGGGIPSEYANTNAKVIQGILNKILDFKEWLNDKSIRLMIEPGRFIAAPAGKLTTQILRIHENNIIVNASVYNSDMDALIVPVKLLVKGEGEGKPYVIKGITPCSLDLFRYRVYLANPKEGDEIIFLNAGAYNFTTNFCDLEEIETEIVE